jgi:signal recognition particle subunit SRP54
LNIPVYSEDVNAKPLALCQRALKKAREMGATWILIDTQGRLHVDEEMMKELTQLKNEIQPSEILLVVDAMTGQDAVKIAEEFHGVLGLTGLILTKMDGDSRGGAALSIRFVTGVPIKFMGVGEKASAIEQFYPDRLASRILGMGDMMSLIEKAEQSFDEQHLKQMEKKLRSEGLTLDDFLQQLNQVKKMGPLNQLLEMIPGVSKLPSHLIEKGGEEQLKKTEAIILSMTQEERRIPSIIDGSRRRRIARGSGTTPRDVNQLLNQFNQLQKLTKIAMKGRLPSDITRMFR